MIEAACTKITELKKFRKLTLSPTFNHYTWSFNQGALATLIAYFIALPSSLASMLILMLS